MDRKNGRVDVYVAAATSSEWLGWCSTTMGSGEETLRFRRTSGEMRLDGRLGQHNPVAYQNIDLKFVDWVLFGTSRNTRECVQLWTREPCCNRWSWAVHRCSDPSKPRFQLLSLWSTRELDEIHNPKRLLIHYLLFTFNLCCSVLFRQIVSFNGSGIRSDQAASMIVISAPLCIIISWQVLRNVLVPVLNPSQIDVAPSTIVVCFDTAYIRLTDTKQEVAEGGRVVMEKFGDERVTVTVAHGDHEIAHQVVRVVVLERVFVTASGVSERISAWSSSDIRLSLELIHAISSQIVQSYSFSHLQTDSSLVHQPDRILQFCRHSRHVSSIFSQVNVDTWMSWNVRRIPRVTSHLKIKQTFSDFNASL